MLIASGSFAERLPGKSRPNPSAIISECKANLILEKALSYPIISSWSLVAGYLGNNAVRLKRHYDLSKQTGRDPLNAVVLSNAHHKSDPPNYRGLGTRTSPKDLGRLVELFFIQAERGKGIGKNEVDLAMKSFHAKEAALDLKKAKEDVDGE